MTSTYLKYKKTALTLIGALLLQGCANTISVKTPLETAIEKSKESKVKAKTICKKQPQTKPIYKIKIPIPSPSSSTYTKPKFSQYGIPKVAKKISKIDNCWKRQVAIINSLVNNERIKDGKPLHRAEYLLANFCLNDMARFSKHYIRLLNEEILPQIKQQDNLKSVALYAQKVHTSLSQATVNTPQNCFSYHVSQAKKYTKLYKESLLEKQPQAAYNAVLNTRLHLYYAGKKLHKTTKVIRYINNKIKSPIQKNPSLIADIPKE